jgi:hypothetical protein
MSHHHNAGPKKFHQSWQFIVAVVLMLAAIIAYVLSQDDRIVPGPAPAVSPAAASGNP